MKGSRAPKDKKYFTLCLILALVIMAAQLLHDRWRAADRMALPAPFQRVAATPAGDFTLMSAAGDTPLATWRGKTIVLHFWATWCVPCRRELPALAAFTERLADHQGIVVIPVALDENAPNSVIAAYLKDVGAGVLAAYQDPLNDSVGLYGLRGGLPSTLVIDPSFRVTAHAVGAVAWDDPAVGDRLRAYMVGLGSAPE